MRKEELKEREELQRGVASQKSKQHNTSPSSSRREEEELSSQEDSTLNDENSPLLGSASSSKERESSVSGRPSLEATFGLVLAPVVELAGWTTVLAFELIDGEEGSTTFYMATFAIFIWVSGDKGMTGRVSNRGLESWEVRGGLNDR